MRSDLSETRFFGNQLFFKQIPQCTVERIGCKLLSKRVKLCRTAASGQFLHHSLGLRLSVDLSLPVGLQNPIGRLLPKPDAGRKNRLDRIVKGAEIPVAQKGRRAEHPLVEQRLVVEHLQNGLQPILLPRLNGEHNALGLPVALPEGHAHALPRNDPERRRNAVIIGLIDGIDRGGDGKLGDHIRRFIR